MKRMKSVFALLLALVMILALAACGGKAEPASPAGSTEPTGTTEPAKSDKPVITAQPEDQTAEEDTLAKFTVEATGDGLTYQWYYRMSPTGSWRESTLDTASNPTLKVKAIPDRNGYQYKCVVSNTAGSVESDVATLTVG